MGYGMHRISGFKINQLPRMSTSFVDTLYVDISVRGGVMYWAVFPKYPQGRCNDEFLRTVFMPSEVQIWNSNSMEAKHHCLF